MVLEFIYIFSNHTHRTKINTKINLNKNIFRHIDPDKLYAGSRTSREN